MQDIINGLKNTELLSFECTFCGIKFNRKVRDVKMTLRKKGSIGKSFCSNACSNKTRDRKINTQCTLCNKDIKIRYCEINSKYRKTKNAFCSRSCAAIFNNKGRKRIIAHKCKQIKQKPALKTLKPKTCITVKIRRNTSFFEKVCINCSTHYKTKSKKSNYCSGRCRNLNLKLHTFAHKSSGRSRSKIEEYLEQKLITDYPNLKIKFNDKDTVYYELDIHIPDYNLAFELNGIFHYLPIYGEETLKKTQYKDQQKLLRCKEKNIDLHVINLGNTRFSKERGDIIYKTITDIIKSRSGQSRTV